MLFKKQIKTILRALPVRLQCLIESRRLRGSLRIGSGSFIHPSVHILGRNDVRIGANTCVSEGSWLNVNHRGGDEPSIEIGSNCFIGKQNFFTSGRRILIGDYTLTTLGCKFIGSSHLYEDPMVPYALSGTSGDDEIKVGVNCFIGAGATLLGNVNVGHGSVIGSGATVLKDVPPFSVAVGFPAKIVKRYSFPKRMWVPLAEFSASDEAAIPDEKAYLSQLKATSGNIHQPWVAAGKSMGDL